jgi:replicative DNA helicase
MVLGACMLGDPKSTVGQSTLQPDDFYKTAHGRIWSAIRRVHERGDEIDLITLPDELRKSGQIDDIGGAAYIAHLVSLVPTTAGFQAHERIVLERAKLRRIIRQCTDAITQAYALAAADQLVTEHITKMGDIRRYESGTVMTYADVIQNGIVGIEQRFENRGKLSGIPTGFAELDRLTDGWQSDFIIVAGRPSMGKTAFAFQTMCAAADHFKAEGTGRKAGVISIEMGSYPVALREISRESGVPLSRLMRGELTGRDWDLVSQAVGAIYQRDILLEFSAFNVQQVERAIDHLVQVMGCRIIMLDYLQLMRDSREFHNRTLQVSEHSSMIKAKVRQHNVPIMVLSQLNRDLEKRPDKRPIAADLRDSGSLEQDADVIIFPFREEVYHKCTCPPDFPCGCGRGGVAEIIVNKGRMIGTGQVIAGWNKDTASFVDVRR